jgi:hypothetical protein
MLETAIQTSNFAPEFGAVGGGLFNITTKSGTNQFHGLGYDYLANEAFNAYTPFVNTRPRIRRNDFGFNFGGPLSPPKLYDGRDRSFFFFNFEQYREFFVVNDTTITVPTDAYRRGDFSSALTGRTLVPIRWEDRFWRARFSIPGRRRSSMVRSFATHFPATSFRKTAGIRWLWRFRSSYQSRPRPILWP